jgi:hypothetical protein
MPEVVKSGFGRALDYVINSVKDAAPWGPRERDNWLAIMRKVGKKDAIRHVDYRDHGSFDNMISDLGSDSETAEHFTVLIPDSVSITQNTVIPHNIALKLVQNGRFVISTNVTLTINGNLHIETKRVVFTGTGLIIIKRMSGKIHHQVFDNTLSAVRLIEFKDIRCKWFGSDAAALQSAINAPYPSGHYDNNDIYSCDVLFGDEVVNIGNNDVTLNRSGISLKGVSRLFSEIRSSGGSIVIPNSVSNINIENMLLYNTDNVSGIMIDIQGVAPNGPRRIAIKGNEFRGGKYKIRIGHCYSSKIIDNYFYSSVAYDTWGIYIDDSVAQSITIRGNQFQDSRLYINGYYGINTEENYFEGSVGPLVDMVRCVGYTHHGNRYECDAAGIVGLNMQSAVAGGSVKGNTFHGSGNGAACVICNGSQNEFGGNYFLRASGGVNPVSLLTSSRYNIFTANYYTATGQQPPISSSGYRNTALKQGLKSIKKYAQELVVGGDALKRYDNEDRIYIELPNSVDSYISVLFELPRDMSDGVDGKYNITIKVYYSAANAPGETLIFAFGYKLLGVDEYPFNSQSEFAGSVLSDLSSNLKVATYDIAQLYPAYWTQNAAKGLSTLCRPVSNNGLWYVVTAAGTTGITEPVWPTTIGDTVVDGGVIWTAQNPLDDFLRVRIRRLPADVSDSFTQTVKVLAVEIEYNAIDFYPIGSN